MDPFSSSHKHGNHGKPSTDEETPSGAGLLGRDAFAGKTRAATAPLLAAGGVDPLSVYRSLAVDSSSPVQVAAQMQSRLNLAGAAHAKPIGDAKAKPAGGDAPGPRGAMFRLTSKNTCLALTRSDLAEIVNATNDGFAKLNVDAVYSSEKFKWTCIAYWNCRETRFRAGLYAMPRVTQGGETRYALEFQRRSGDGYYFHQLFAAMQEELESKGLVSVREKSEAGRAARGPPTSPVQSRPKIFAALPLPVDFDGEEHEVSSVSTGSVESAPSWTAQVATCASPYLEIQRQALGHLCVCLAETKDRPSGTALRSEATSIIETLVRTVSTAPPQRVDEEVQRLATSCLANLAASEADIQRMVVKKGAAPALSRLLVREDSPLETRRESARALAELCRTCPAEVLSSVGGGKGALARLVGACKDKRLKSGLERVEELCGA